MAGRAGLTDVEIAFVTLAADDHAATAQQAPEPLEMLLADDAGQVWGALGVVAIETGDGALQGGHQLRLLFHILVPGFLSPVVAWTCITTTPPKPGRFKPLQPRRSISRVTYDSGWRLPFNSPLAVPETW